jgi:hypothetical protein
LAEATKQDTPAHSMTNLISHKNDHIGAGDDLVQAVLLSAQAVQLMIPHHSTFFTSPHQPVQVTHKRCTHNNTFLVKLKIVINVY